MTCLILILITLVLITFIYMLYFLVLQVHRYTAVNHTCTRTVHRTAVHEIYVYRILYLSYIHTYIHIHSNIV